MRPNSPPQSTSVSSSRPRAFRSVEQAGDRLVDLAGRCWRGPSSGRRAGPTCSCASTCTNRTPRSANRRAIRHWRPKFCGRRSSSPYSLMRRRRSRRRCPAPRAPRPASGRPARTSAMRPSSAWIGAGAGQVLAVHLLEQVELQPLERRAACRVFVMNGIFAWSDGMPALPIGVPW